MVCPRCGKENDAENLFCARCGLEFAQVVATVQDQSDALPCYRHPRERTLLRCGRCDRPICTRCAVLGSAGPRCPDCARNKVAFRPAAVAHEARVAGRSLLRMGPWAWYALFFLVSAAFGLWRGCMRQPRIPPERTPRVETRDQAPPTDER